MDEDYKLIKKVKYKMLFEGELPIGIKLFGQINLQMNEKEG